MKLTDTDIQERLAEQPAWILEGKHLVRHFIFDAYSSGVAFAVRVAMLSEAIDHHPDSLEIGWKKVRVAYLTHSVDGITILDFAAATQVDALV